MPRATGEERRTIERFSERYERTASPGERAVELAAIGGNVGANGYTTVAQVERLARALRLKPGTRLLDIGCGRGYPSLLLARISGCDAVGVDLPMASIRIATQRARQQRLRRRAVFLAASAVHLPFRAQSFDAITHTDVLC